MTQDVRDSIQALSIIAFVMVAFVEGLWILPAVGLSHWFFMVGLGIAIVNLFWFGYSIWKRRNRGQKEIVNG